MTYNPNRISFDPKPAGNTEIRVSVKSKVGLRAVCDEGAGCSGMPGLQGRIFTDPTFSMQCSLVVFDFESLSRTSFEPVNARRACRRNNQKKNGRDPMAGCEVRCTHFGVRIHRIHVLKRTHFGCFLSGFESFLLETFNTFEGNLNLVFPRENESFVTHG